MRAPVLLLFATVCAAQAQTLSAPPSYVSSPVTGTPGVGNLPPDFYPKSPCPKPDITSIGNKPGDAREVKAVDGYNKRVQAYNKSTQVFNACIVDYAAKAQNDIARIQAAIRDANAH